MSIDRETSRSPASAIGSAAITTGSPIRTSSAASSRSAAPMSMWRPFELDHLLALVGLEQVDRFAADDAGDDPVAGADLDPLADQDLRVPAADRGEPEEALLVDVGDREADLVDVADDRQQRGGVADPWRSRSRSRRS